MNIEDYADVLNLELEIRRYPNQQNRYTAQFDHCEVKENAASGIIGSAYGNGRTPAEAVADYLRQIRGKLLVVHAGNPEKRRQYVVPTGLTV